MRVQSKRISPERENTEQITSATAVKRNPQYPNLVKPEKGERVGLGRQKGTPNKTTMIVRDATLEALTLEGFDGKGKDGLVGWIRQLARKEPKTCGELLIKIMPTQLQSFAKTDITPNEDGSVTMRQTMSAAEMEEKLMEYGIQAPNLIDVTPTSVKTDAPDPNPMPAIPAPKAKP